MTYRTRVHLYEKTLIIYGIHHLNIPDLKIDPFKITDEDERLIDAIFDIDEAMIEMQLGAGYFKRALKAAPFNGLTPEQHIIEHGRTGLLETRIYILALRVHMLDILNKGEL